MFCTFINIHNMTCIACGKENPSRICHQCKIIMSTQNFSEDELIAFKNTKLCTVKSLEELKQLKVSNYTNIQFNCVDCGTTYVGLFKKLKKKDILTCPICTGKRSTLKRYGVDNVSKLPEIKEKIRKTTELHFGVSSYLQTQDARDKRKKLDYSRIVTETAQYLQPFCRKVNFGEIVHPNTRDTHTTCYLQLSCTCFCGKEYTTNVRRMQRCPDCYPQDWANGTSKSEQIIADYIRSIYSGTVEQHNKSILPNHKELDIYLPELKVAIEFDGDYWHGCSIPDSEVFNRIKEEADYKCIKCRELGIRLITIKECDFNQRPDVFYRFIQDTILPRKRVFARKCKLYNIDAKTARSFCEQYHVNGYRQSSIRYGLYYENELICVATFSRHPKYQYECVRLCYKTGIQIIGGWDKIIKHFGHPFLHYINLQYFQGENKTGVGFRFLKGNVLLSQNTLRLGTQLKKYCPQLDNKKTTVENIINNGFTAIFDCGNDIRLY